MFKTLQCSAHVFFYKKHTFLKKVKLTLILFIDDLDRVLGGRKVDMHEAIQLLLNVPFLVSKLHHDVLNRTALQQVHQTLE